MIAEARTLGIDVAGVHFHVGSQLARVDESLLAVERLAAFCERARAELGWTPQVLDIGGGLGIRYTREEHVPEIAEFVGPLVARLRERWPDPVQLVLEPGRSLVGRAGVTLYRVGVVKQSGGVSFVAIDGGMSDNPRPQLYGARYEALLANRADELADGVFRIAGKHCESGDVLIDAAELPHPRRGDLLAVPATGAYTLAMGSNYNGVPRPAVVLVRDGEGARDPAARDRRRPLRLRRGSRTMMKRLTERIPGVVLVSIAAAMWGLDGLIRKPLSHSTSPATIVFGEHVVLVALTLPLLVPARSALWRAGRGTSPPAIAVGAGASAIATILFTQALFHGDFITVLVLQKVQPLVAVAGAWLVLGEQPRPRFAWFLLPALAGIWLIEPEHPLEPTAHGLIPIMQALGAAVLWALGTVLGRYLGRELAFEHVPTLRFAFGLIASAAALPVIGCQGVRERHDSAWIAVLALVTGLLALGLYYYGLQRTPALLAALGELAFPVTAAVVGIYVFNSNLRWTQWLGVARSSSPS